MNSIFPKRGATIFATIREEVQQNPPSLQPPTLKDTTDIGAASTYCTLLRLYEQHTISKTTINAI